MKTNYLLTAILLMAFISAHAQIWDPVTGNVLSADPPTTRVGIGITNPFDFDALSSEYSGAFQVGLLLQGEVGSGRGVFNYGHLLEGDFGAEANDTRWFTLGGPGFTTLDINLYGARFQFDEYAVNLALADRDLIGIAPGQESRDGGSLTGDGVKDAILFWNSGLGQDGVPLSDLRIGPTRGAGKIIRRITIDGSRDGNIEIRTGDEGHDGSGDINIFTENTTDENAGSIFITAGGSGSDSDAGNIVLRTKSGDRDGSISMFGGGDINMTVDPIFSVINMTGFVRVNNDLQVLGTFTNPSDRRFKSNIESMGPEVTDKLGLLNPTTYNFKEDSPVSQSLKDNLQYGVIAQELEQIFPSLVMEDRDGYKTVNYLAFIPMLIQAHKDQQEAIDVLEARIDELLDEKESTNSGSVDLTDEMAIAKASLSQNTPNPFNESTTINYTLPDTYTKAELFIFDMNGKQEKSFALQGEPVELNGYSLEAGLYIYSLVVDGEIIDTKRMLLTK